MAEGVSPTVARLRLRTALREARQAAGLTQAQVAKAMEWSLSKVIRIENGQNGISPSDLRSLLTLLEVDDAEPLLADARIVRAAHREEPPFRHTISDSLRRFIDYEADAAEIRSFAVYYLPDAVQTPEYGAALTMMQLDPGRVDAKKADALAEVRRHRADALRRRPRSARYLVVVDESALRRQVGGVAVLAGQLRHLVELTELGLLELRMLGFDHAGRIANNASFDLATVGARGQVLYRDNGTTDEVVEDRAETSQHRDLFEQLWLDAAVEDETIDFIRRRLELLEARVGV
ncbi:helix-turn-helix transcriptional regulator [Actinoplanes bogorensis]|uniref:Helix-turn-helix transcriptional regulator n=1 Tax=Paractinoplanes bogorensis TaxID=1610840 RepID=A0ABS5YZW2_9ACTN|nr:helix-turn-helix transcriptional regulator [Actinoplanes bogorensis]MBU2667650.1 helix-turn-helix transcriptional regulator [Actinoplanes bogorensis]